MIEIKTFAKAKNSGSGSSSGSSSKTAYINTTVSEADHAAKADKATRAENADRATYADRAGTAQNAAYATKAGDLADDAEVLDDYLFKGETTEMQEVKGKVTFDEAITFAKQLLSLGTLSFGNNGYQIDSLGNAVLESLRSLDYANASEQGFSIEREGSGRYHEFITNLTVWGKAVFHELEIRKLSYAGGNIYLSGAGSKLVKVVPVSWDETSAAWAATTPAKCEGWKCYLLADDGTTATMNWWQEGDQVRCQTVGEITSAGTYQDVSNKSYWRTIPENGVSTANEKIYADDGVTELYDGQGFAWIVIGKHSESLDGYTEDTAPTETKDEPAAGDTIVLDGNRHRGSDGTYDKEDRQNVILMETTGDDAPRIAGYYKITEYKHTYTDKDGREKPLYVFLLSSKEGVKLNTSKFEWIGTDGSSINMPNYRGDWAEGTSYYKNDQVSHNNAVWICIANSGVAVTDEPTSSSANWKMVIEGGKGDTPTISGTEVKYGISSSPSNEPSEWQDTPIDTSSKENQGKFLWVKTIIKWTIGTETKTTESKAVSYIGKDGDNGTSVSIKGSLTDKSQLPTSGNDNGDGYLIDGYLWIYTATTTEDDTHHNGFENVGKIRGDDGISATQYYYHVAWMNTSDNSDGSFTTSNPDGAAYAYIGTKVDEEEADDEDWTNYDWVYVKGDQGEAGKNSVRLDLTNENSSVTCDKDGNVVGTVQTTIARLYDGATQVKSPDVTFALNGYSGLASAPTVSKTSGYVSGITLENGTDTLTGKVSIQATYNGQTYLAVYSITKVLAGSDGTPATSYWLTPSATAVKVDSDGNATPSTLSCKKYKQVGSASPVETSDFQLFYKTSAMSDDAYNSYGGALVPDTSLEWYELVLASDTPTADGAIIYDRETVPVVKDGKDGEKGEKGESGSGFVPAYIRSESTPSKPTTTDKSNMDGGWSLDVPADVTNVSYGDSSWVDYVEDGVTWKKSPTTADNKVSSCLVTFTTTAANQKVCFVLKAYSEPNFDYAYLSAIDATTIPARKDDTVTSRQVSGNGKTLEITDTIATAGTHTVYFCYGKDTSGASNGDYGLIRIVGGALWQSNGTENGDTISSWSEPFKVSGEDGKQGEQGKSALEVVISPETLVFDTNDDGVVPSGTTGSATITCYRDGVQVTDVDYTTESTTHCLATCTQNNGAYTVKITKIETEDVTTDGETSTISKTSGTVDVVITDNATGTNQRAQVKFAVNLSKFDGHMVNTTKQLSNTLSELTNDGSITSLTMYKSEILQTAREISLSVSEKAVGRRNLLPGSAFRKQDEGCYINLYGNYSDNGIHINDGLGGVNCLKVTSKTNEQYCGAFWSKRGGGEKNIKVKRNTTYTFSCYMKVNSKSLTLALEAYNHTSETETTTHGTPTLVSGKSMYTPEKTDEWVLYTYTFTVGDYDYIEANAWILSWGSTVEAYICKPMLEEGDKYNGWTMSEQDYDYVGGNLIDNSRTLTAVSGKLAVNGTVTQSGYGGESAVLYKGMSALLGRVSTKYSLPSSASSGDKYATTNDWKVWQYTGTSVSDDDHYNGWERVSGEMLHNDILVAYYSLEANKDYIFSWYAKGSGRTGAYVAGANQTVFVEHSDGEVISSTTYGEHAQLLTNGWKRYWVHVRCLSGAVNRFIIRQYRNDDNTASTIYISQPKLEEGATMTEWTEKKTDLVDKQALLATGIDIESRKVTVTADKFVVQNNSGEETLLVTQDGMLNTDIVKAKTLETVATDGTRILIKDGLMKFFNPSGVCNIQFGINADGYSVLSYYDNDGKWLYDLGPSGLDAKSIRSSSLESDTYVMASSYLGTSSFYQSAEFTVGSKTYTVLQALSAYETKLFGVRMYADNDTEVKQHSHVGYTPFSKASSVKLYKYTAAKQSNAYVADTANGIPSAAAAKLADGKYFTGTPSYDSSTGAFTNLASGLYFLKTAAVQLAPYPMATTDTGTFKYPAYCICCVSLLNGQVGSPSMIYGTILRTISMSTLA